MDNAFFFPCNLQFYDVCAHFKKQNRIVWRKSCNIKNGDIVYIYIGKPYYEVRYKCIVVSDKVDPDLLDANAYAITIGALNKNYQYIQLELLYSFLPKSITLQELKWAGIAQFMIPMHLPLDAYDLFREKETKATHHGTEGDENGD